MKFFIQLTTSLYLLFFCTITFSAENTFYLLHANPKQIKELTATLDKIKKNHEAMQILIAQAYRINKANEITGYINQEVVTLAKKYSIKVMAMITNAGYDQKTVHQFLSSRAARENAIQFLLTACKHYHLYGVQFDFEGISINDKKALTQFYQHAADVLHKEDFKISYAVIPALKPEVDDSIFLRKTYKNWSGVYDLTALGKSADFITIMAYNQHPDGTIPGPTASIGYVEAAIKTALQEIPANKLSLGVPAYSLYWFSGYYTVASHDVEISYKDASHLIQQHHAGLLWNDKDKVNYSVYEHNWLNEYIYLEDVNSFKAKLSLVKKYKLRGISIFRIGTEDNRIWAVLKNKAYV